MRQAAILLLTVGLVGCVTMPEGMLPKAGPAPEAKTPRTSMHWSADQVNEKNASRAATDLWDDLDREEAESNRPATKLK